MRVAYEFHSSAKTLDPAKIETAYQYDLIWNLYNRLVEYDNNMQIVAGAPESFSVENSSVVFTFGKKSQGHSGLIIGPEDAAASLKRLIIFGKSGHGDIRRFLCPNQKLNSIFDDCTGIKVDQNKLVLTATEPHLVPLLIETLTSADYSIIPKRNIDKNNALIDFSDSTGAYYIGKDAQDGCLILKANQLDYHFSSTMPQEISLVPVPTSGGIEKLRNSEVDFLPTTEYYREATMLKQDLANFNYHKTLPLKLLLVGFSERAQKDFTSEQRMYVGNKIAEVVGKHRPQYGGQPTIQFFQALSDGGLTELQKGKITSLRSTVKPPFEKPVQLAVHPTILKIYEDLFKDVPELRVVPQTGYSYELPASKRPDAFITATDSSWTEDINLIGYNINSGLFSWPGFDSNAWLEKYLRLPQKDMRIKMLNDLHYKLLVNASFVPIDVAPCYSFSTKKWEMVFSNFHAVTEFWKIKKGSTKVL
jgi:hypothetical protein